MKPIGKKVLIKQDIEITRTVVQSKGGLITSINLDEITKQVLEDTNSYITEEGMNSFKDKVETETKIEETIKKFNSGVILSVGFDLESHPDFKVGDRVEFSSSTVKITPEGEELLLINVESLTTNLSRS